jgi:hypothetical protein
MAVLRGINSPVNFDNNNNNNNNNNSVALVRQRTIAIEQPPLVGEASANFCGKKGGAWLVLRIPTSVNSVFLTELK